MYMNIILILIYAHRKSMHFKDILTFNFQMRGHGVSFTFTVLKTAH